MKRILLILVIFSAFFSVSFFLPKKEVVVESESVVLGEDNENFSKKQEEKNNFSKNEKNVVDLNEEKELPKSIVLEVPFLSQAPFSKWDALHEDACEEASLLMIKYFFQGEKIISKDEGEKEIQSVIKFEKENGYEKSITLKELSEIANKFYKMKNGRIEKNINVEKIKKELADGKPVIVGAAGKILPNPNFKNGGPNYHMLVVKGYDEKGFITNDPGTRLGENFRYTFEDLQKSIHDWNEKNILNGEKNYLVFD